MSGAPTNVAIVGAGPVGLVLAHLLAEGGLEVSIFEQRESPWEHSRAIGIHPVSLEILDSVGVAAPLVTAGVEVRGGRALAHMQTQLGALRFDGLPAPFPFVLSLPQQRLESILERALEKRRKVSIFRSHRLVTLVPREHNTDATFETTGGDRVTCSAQLVVGCDGKESAVRTLIGIAYEGAPYPDRFLMGDFEDNTPFGDEAAIFLHPEGLIECFPLPLARRRWVVKVDEHDDDAEDDERVRRRLEELVMARVGHRLEGVPAFMLSRFGVQHYLAEAFFRGRVALAGDAAHVVSPIGGQGMNLGILDAARLASGLGPDAKAMLSNPGALAAALRRYEGRSRAIARKATRRSSFFMYLGQKRARPAVRNALVKLLLSKALATTSARLFTMRGLSWTPF